MAYLPSKRSGPGALSGISDVATAVRDVVSDPCLFQVAQMVGRLNDLQQPSRPSSAPAGPRVPGIGLCSAVGPLRIVTYAAERPWLAGATLTLFCATLVGLGYMAGKGR